MKKRFVDTNIFLRYLTADDKAQYLKCKALFERTLKGKEELYTSAMVIAEVTWTLLSYYKVPKEDVIEKITIILNTPNLEVENRKVFAEALEIYSLKNIDFIDAYNAAFMTSNKLDEIYSYDKDFDKIDSLERRNP